MKLLLAILAAAIVLRWLRRREDDIYDIDYGIRDPWLETLYERTAA